MTYAQFILFFITIPSIALFGLGYLSWGDRHFRPVDRTYHWRGVAILALIAFVWTTPWDNYLIARGVWDSPADRVLARIGYVPVEEYAFFILMPVFNGALFWVILPSMTVASSTWRRPQKQLRAIALLIGGVLFLGGIYALRYEGGTYLGLILVWFTPPLLLQWLFDPCALLRSGKMVLWGTFLPLLYFALADSYAIGAGIWVIAEGRTSGIGLPQLPFEEFLFFGVTSLLLAQGLTLWHSLRPIPSAS